MDLSEMWAELSAALERDLPAEAKDALRFAMDELERAAYVLQHNGHVRAWEAYLSYEDVPL